MSWILALDPGRNKTGAALIRRDDGGLVRRSVLNTLGLVPDLRSFVGTDMDEVHAVVIGDGTSCDSVRDMVERVVPDRVLIETIDEKDTTLEARQLFYDEFPPRGLLGWMPRGLWPEPDVLLDGYAAEILGRRYLEVEKRAARG